MPRSKRTKTHHKSKRSNPITSTKRTACPKKKLKWIPMKITRTPLNPLQAVLSCCDAALRDAVNLAANNQCAWNESACSGDFPDSITVS